MTLAVLLVLLAIGFTLIGLELFITPGFILGIIGLLFLGAGVWMSYDQYGNTVGHIVFGIVALTLVTGVVLTLRSGFWQRLALHDQITGKANQSHRYELSIGAQGTTLSALRPTGSALIDGKRYEVHTSGEFIDAKQEIEISKINSNKILVKLKN